MGDSPLPSPSLDVAQQIATIRAAIETASKSVAWRMRARVGERVKWYEVPEEVGH